MNGEDYMADLVDVLDRIAVALERLVREVDRLYPDGPARPGIHIPAVHDDGDPPG